MSTEGIVYLLRKTNLTREDIGNLHPSQFGEILKETYYQESVDEWRRQYSVASIMAAIYNTIPRKRGSGAIKASDFLKGGMPTRELEPKVSLEKMAEEKGIKLPKEKHGD